MWGSGALLPTGEAAGSAAALVHLLPAPVADLPVHRCAEPGEGLPQPLPRGRASGIWAEKPRGRRGLSLQYKRPWQSQRGTSRNSACRWAEELAGSQFRESLIE